MTRTFFGLTPESLGGTSLALGIALTLVSRAATGNIYPNSGNPASLLAKILLIASRTIKTHGYYALPLAMLLTGLGTLLLANRMLEKTRFSESKATRVAVALLPLAVCIGTFFIGMHNKVISFEHLRP